MDYQWTISDLAKVVNAKVFATEDKKESLVKAIETDSRKDLHGALFLALRGERLDGHAFCAKAIAQGAAALCVDQEDVAKAYEEQVPILLVKDTRLALNAIAKDYKSKLNSTLIAITGSVGKTSTKDLIAAALAPHRKVQKTRANINNRYGVQYTLLEGKQDTEIQVIECGTGKEGDLEEMSSSAQAEITVITNIGTAHIEFFPSRLALAREKAAIASHQKEGGPLLINAEDPYLLAIAKEEMHKRPIYFVYSKGEGAYLRSVMEEDQSLRASSPEYIEELAAEAAKYQGANLYPEYPSGTLFTFDHLEESSEGVSFKFQVKKAGEEIETLQAVRLAKASISLVQNALFALSICQILDCNLAKSAKALETAELTAGRLETFDLDESTTVINDAYNASPESMQAAMHFASVLSKAPKYEGKIAIIGGINELGTYAEQLHETLGKSLGSYRFDRYYLIGPWSELMRKHLLKEYPNAHVVIYPERELLEKEITKADFQSHVILVKASRSYGLEHICKKLEEVFYV